MTDPNPLKQAAEEAKARKLAEIAAESIAGAPHGVEEALLLVEAEESRKRIPASLEIVVELEINLPAGERYEDAMKRNGVVHDGNAQSVYEQMLPFDETYPACHQRIAILKARTTEPTMTLSDLKQALMDAAITPAGIREIAEVAGNISFNIEGTVIAALSQRLSTPVPGVGGWLHRFPILKYIGVAFHQRSVTGDEEVIPSVVFIPIILAGRPSAVLPDLRPTP